VKTLKPSLATLGASTSTGGWKPDQQRGNRHQRGYGTEWEHTRKRILERDTGLCQPGLKRGDVHAGNQVDHITSKAEARALGWPTAKIEADDNLQTICDACHRLKTSSESRGGGRVESLEPPR
jgi:5-methylcytosine-specific restriction protein A